MESLHCFFLFGWIKLKFGVRGNFRLLTSNLNSKTQYQFEILRKCHSSSLTSWFFTQHSTRNWLPWQQWVTYLQSFNFKNLYMWLPKNDISLVKISYTVFEIFSQNPRKPSIFQLSHFDDVIKFFRQFVKTSTHSISLPSFIVIWLEIAQLGGAKMPPSLFRSAKSPVQIGLTCHSRFEEALTMHRHYNSRWR